MEIAPNAGGGFDVLPDREHFDTLGEAEGYVRSMSVMEPTTRWQALSLEQVMRSASLVDSFATNQRLRPFVEAAIEATAAGEIVPGTTWTKEAAADVLRLWDVLGAFLSTAIRESGPTPLEVISRYA